MIKTLDRLGCDLDIFVVQKRPIMDSSWARQYQLHQIKPPSLGSVAIRALAALLSGAQTLNECLYRSPKTHRVVRSAVSLAGAQAVIADGIRLAELAHRTGLPYLLDLDDPLSDRYEALVSANSDTSAILGYFAASIPRWLTGPATRLARLLLAREAKLLKRREHSASIRADAVSLVSEWEARSLSARVGRAVTALPAAISHVATRPEGQSRPELAFLGGLDYLANLESLRWYRDEVVPRLRDLQSVPAVHVIGYCPPGVEAEFAGSGLVFEGFVDDLYQALGEYRALIAPITSGTGIKTKVLDAMACGVPVVGTAMAFSGLHVTSQKNAYIADDAREFASLLIEVRLNPLDAERVGRAGQEFVREHFSPSVLAARWRAVLLALGVKLNEAAMADEGTES